MKHLFAALVSVLVLSAACVDPEGADPSLDDGDSLPDDAVVYDTVATLAPDGSLVMSTPRPITIAEQRAQNVVRMQGGGPTVAYNGFSLVNPGGEQDLQCNDDSLWVYSRTDYTGDRICFRGAGYTFHMREYPRFRVINGYPNYVGTWNIPSGSFIAGTRGGMFVAYNPALNTYATQTFTPNYAFFGTFQFATPLTEITMN